MNINNKNWLNDKVELSYREIFQLLKEHGDELLITDIDNETLSFDKLMTLYQENHNGNIPYNGTIDL